MNNIFCVISAIGNNYGIFSYGERLKQLKNTIDSIYTYAQGSDILMIESSEELIPEEDIEYFKTKVSHIIFLNKDEYITFLKHHSKDPTPNKFEKKTVGEIQSCLSFLNFLSNHPKKYDRVFKLGGRLSLNSNFNLNNYKNEDKLVVLDKEQWYDEWIFPMRLWSFSYKDKDKFLNMFNDIQLHTYDHVKKTGELKLVEFSFTKFVEKLKIPYTIVEKVGVWGYSGLNATKIDE